jgi:hypothetical protein
MVRHLRRLFRATEPRGIRITEHVYSEQGGAHPENEDAVEVCRHGGDSALWICCLADGQGGQPGGARAAQVAVQTALAEALAQPPRALLKPPICEDIVRAADQEVYTDPQAGFTTLVICVVRDRLVCGASCGDSAAVVVQGDDSVVLTAEQRSHPAVGSRAARGVSFYLELDPPWHLCAVSDGVWKYTGWDRLIALMRRHRGRDLTNALRAAAIKPGNLGLPDDFSIASFTGDPVDY